MEQAKEFEDTSIMQGIREFVASDGETYRFEKDSPFYRVSRQLSSGAFLRVGKIQIKFGSELSNEQLFSIWQDSNQESDD